MDFKTLLNKKRGIKATITRLKTKTEGDIQTLNLAELEVRKNRFFDITNEIKDIFNSIIAECKEDEIEDYCNEKDDLLDIVEQMLALIGTNIHKNCETELLKGSIKGFDSADVKLPTLNLPCFSGKIEEWLTFSDLFRAAVSDNQTLTGAQKLQYLKGVLRGDALRVINSLSITNGNFQIAWDLLTERYFNKREILSSLMKKFINMTPLNNESYTQMLNLIDSTKEFVRTLESLNFKIDQTSDSFLMFSILFKLDSNTRTWFERTLTADTIPKLKDLLQFLSTHARSIMTGSQCTKRNFQKKVALVASKIQRQCPLCHKDHTLSKCEKFTKMLVQKRWEFVKTNNVCFNCLTQFHSVKACKSKFRCHTCKKSHHTLLHNEFVNGRDKQASGNMSTSNELSVNAPVFSPTSVYNHSGYNETSENSGTVDITSCISNVGPNVQILLCTAIIRVRDLWGKYQTCRCLLDSGSQASLITSECIERLGLSKQKANIRISCLGSADTRTTGISEIHFTPHFTSQRSFSAVVYVVNKIVGILPHQDLDSTYPEIFGDLTLADPTFHKSSQVDILLGIDLALPLLKGQTLSVGDDKPFAVRSELGWVIGGKASSFGQTLHVNNIQLVSDELINKFWELDSVPRANPLTSLEISCEEHYKETHSRNEDGRYTVRLPFKSSPKQLGKSKEIALRRLISIERHLTSDPEKYNRYRQFMNEYLDLNHMEAVPKDEYDKTTSYYLPHHAVLRDSSSTTKLRVVFNASSKTSSGLSLNDLLMVGPRVQPELYPVLIQFRTFQVAVCADIEKMFRQIKVHKEDADWQRILWRNSPEDAISEYRLTTVTYGTTCAPYLSTRTLKQLALDEKERYPNASRATLTNFYVDDFLGGAATKEDAVQLVTELQEMATKGGFHLRKWNSNDPSIFQEVSNDVPENDLVHLDDKDYSVLGVKWSPKLDVFKFTVSPVKIKDIYTKREVLSQIARVFDPLGLLSPCVIFMKILLQKLWLGKFSWDQSLPDELCLTWRTFLEELHLLELVTFPRYVLNSHAEVEIHAFCDASEKAYCATIYLRCISADSVQINLLTSKTRVAPLKVQSLPRLELCSALLLSNLLHATLSYLDFPVRDIFAWSDSKITLAWIKSEPSRWQPFVANRVAQIQQLMPTVKWNFVCGRENPADCGTRGFTPSQFVNSDLWLNGPKWLKDPLLSSSNDEEDKLLSQEFFKEERKQIKLVMLQTAKDTFKPEFFERYSSWNKLRRVLAWCFRFVKNCTSTDENRVKTFLTTDELNYAEKIIVKTVQQVHFSAEILCLQAGRQLPSSNRILPLSPFIDDSELLRVGGRLRNSVLPEEKKHPLLLPKSDHVVELIIKHYHLTLLHAGPELIQASVREKFWILSARDAVRKVVRKCISCFRNRPKLSEQVMGDLPEPRVCPSTVFQNTGLDFTGPFLTRTFKGRGSRNSKSYVCVFVCLATKAVHLEIVSDMTAKAFIASLKRFISRRGKPVEIFCDCGSNFFGANRELTREYREVMKENSICEFFTMNNIKFRFNPPAAPHFGGIWESVVKSFKFHLKRVIGISSVTFEELATITSQIEACLNSRPISAISSDPNDLTALTPGHFLIGKPLTAVPQSQIPENISHCDRWRMLQRMVQHFWNRWSREYLTRLQSRTKWRTSQDNLNIGDLVLIKQENLAPLQWKLGRISKTFPGRDHKVRVVELKTQAGKLLRPITKLCRLPIS